MCYQAYERQEGTDDTLGVGPVHSTGEAGQCPWGKGLVVEPLGQGHIHRTKRRVRDGNKTRLITYPENDRVLLLKSRMGKKLKSDSVKVLIAASGRR